MATIHSKYLVSKTFHEVCLPINGCIWSCYVLVLWGQLQSVDQNFIILIIVLVFLLHEVLHILVVNKKGDISLTFKGIYFWLNSNAILSKRRYWVFMSLPFIALTVVPAIASFFVSGDIKSILIFISWYNLITSSSDILNSVLILMKPSKSMFYRGYYSVNS